MTLKNTFKTFVLFSLSFTLFCLSASAQAFHTGGLTTIKEIVNTTPYNVTISMIDSRSNSGVPSETVEVSANATRGAISVIIPWASNAEDFRTKRITISVNGSERFWIWQNGSNVKFNSSNAFAADARNAPGLSASGGNRRLTITMLHVMSHAMARSNPTFSLSEIPGNTVIDDSWFVQTGNNILKAMRGIQCIGAIVSETFGWTTSITEIRNNTPQTIKLWKAENNETIEVRPNSTYRGAFYIPWVDNADQYRNKHMTISANGRTTVWLWQNGPHVRFRTNAGFVDNATPVPGESKSGGDRTLILEMRGGHLAFAFVYARCNV